MPQTRQLAAIMFTDIVGYTTLMGDDEQKAFEILTKSRELQKPIIEKYNGRWIKELGDGVLASFVAVSDAVHAAQEIQELCRNSGAFSLRIGIHLGEIILEEGDVFGDAVNICSRLQTLAPVGGIYISEAVQRNISNKKDITTIFVREENLRNVKDSINIYEIINKESIGGSESKPPPRVRLPKKPLKYNLQWGLTITGIIILLAVIGFIYWNKTDRNTEQITSIAVLPFVNESRIADMEYLSEGMTETLINSLSKLKDVSVKARSSVFRYKGKDIDPKKVGDELAVKAILNGRVSQRGENIMLALELVDVSTGNQIWGEQYNRKTTDLVALQSDIASDVSNKLKGKLSGAEEKNITNSYTQNAEAYQHYLKGRFYWNKRTGEDLKKALREFESAVEADSNYALAYVGIADCYLLLEEYAGVPASERLLKARVAADRALALSPMLAEAHTSSAYIYQQLWRWEEAEKEYKQAIKLDPKYATAHHWYSIYFRAKMQLDQSKLEIERALESDPLAPILNTNLASIHYLNGDVNAAIERCNKALEINPEFPQAHTYLGFCFLKQGRKQQALAAFQKAVQSSGRAGTYLSDLGYYYAVAGQRAEALGILKELEEKYSRREAIGMYLAGVCVGLRDREKSFFWLEKDFAEHSGLLPQITWWFNFESLRSDPRFITLVKRMGI